MARAVPKYHAVRYDRRGYGKSEAAKALFSPLDDLLRVMEHTKIRKQLWWAARLEPRSPRTLRSRTLIAYKHFFLIGPVVHGMRSSDYSLQRGKAASAPLAN